MRFALELYDIEDMRRCSYDPCFNCHNYVMVCYGGNPTEKCVLEEYWDACTTYEPVEFDVFFDFGLEWYKRIHK